MLNPKDEYYLKIIFTLSLIALISAYFIEYILGHQPCNLCLIERIPYGLSMIFIIVIFTLRKNEKFLILLLILTFFFSFAISIYHYGIEQGFFSESLVCDLGSSNENMSKEDLLKQLRKTPISCKDVTFRFFGLSLATINTVISILLSAIMCRVIKNYGKNQ